MAKLKKINVFSFAKFLTILMTFVGLVAGILYSFGGLFIDVLVSIGWISSVAVSTPGLSYGTVLAFGALIGMPIIFVTFGLIIGIILPLLYNLIARWFGGIELDFE